MPESRTAFLEPEALTLVRQASVDIKSVDLEEIRNQVPKALTRRELSEIDSQIASAVENEAPSHYGYERGRKAGEEAIVTLGLIAVTGGDLVTAENAKKHLRHWPWTIDGLLGARALGKEVKRHKAEILHRIMNP